MTDFHRSEEVTANNERALKKLARSITNSLGNFALILVRCNYSSLKNQMVKRLKEFCAAEIREIQLSPSVKTLYTSIQAELGDEQPQAVMIFGLEMVEESEQVLVSANQVREEFRKNFPFPLVLWINDEILNKLTRVAPDLKSWAPISIKFEIVRDELIEVIKETVDAAFAAIVNVGAGKFLNLASLLGERSCVELEPALKNLREINEGELTPELQAGLHFLIGREADIKGEKMQARQAYEESLSFWQTKVQGNNPSSQDFSRYGCILFHLGLWWRQYASQHRVEYDSACWKAKEYYQRGMAAFQQSGRADISANFINALGEVLTRLQQWDELEKVARTAISLHQTYPEPVRLAYSYGLLAEVALQKSNWNNAKSYAELALKTNDEASTSDIDWEWERRHYRNFYLLLLGQAQQRLNRIAEATSNLEVAKTGSNPQHDPILYIRILEALRSLKFEQKEYLESFEIKREQRSIEQQYGLRAFVGAGRLEARRQVSNSALAPADQQLAVNQEIAASGRLLDINRLIERISRADHKLTVIYGQSGVGKSSLVQAGLLPVLKQRAVEARDVLPVLLQVYSDWAKSFGLSFAQSFEEVRGLSLPVLLDSMAEFLAELRKSTDRNLLTVLIFDQFEEFFFAYKDATQRKPFFEFLRDCLNIPYVKVILSLREDYLHYLLECNRLNNLDAIDNNILDKKILYYLGNFSPEDARSVIRSLTDNSQFYLEPELIDVLVQDLAGELGEVRPIELQVVGMQLQTEKITTLAQYQERGPKEKLVGNFLSEVVKDCGSENEQFAKIILYLLTDENNTRPLKTRAELEADLALETERLDLILKILVKSGLLFQVPGFPAERYQLVHDYLVPFIRQQQSARLIAELEKEKEQRKLTEAKLNQVLRQQLKTARRAGFTLAALLLLIGGFGVLATLIGINVYLSNLNLASSQNQELDRLVSAIKGGKQLKQLRMVAIPGIRLETVAELNQAINNLTEMNRLEGHTGGVTGVSFSPDGKLIASISEDQTAKIWKLDGKQLATLKGHTGDIISVSFSSNNKLVASTGEDKTVRIWRVDGTPLKTLLGHKGTVTSASFSPDGKMIASASEDNTVKLWSLPDGKEIKTLAGHTGGVTSVSFSPNGKLIASADKDETVILWNRNGNALQKINNYGAVSIKFTPDSKMIIFTNKDGSVKYYDIDGVLVKNMTFDMDKNIKTQSLSSNAKVLAISRQKTDVVRIFLMKKTDNSYYIDYNNSLAGHTDIVLSLNFSPDSKILASASKDKVIKLWNIGSEIGSSNQEITDSQVRVSPDNSVIAVAVSGKKVRLLDKHGRLLKTIPADGSILEFSPGGKTIATGSAEDTVKIWSLDGRELTLKGHPDGTTSMSISPDGKSVVTGGNDGKVNFWDSNGNLINTQVGHRKQVKTIKFSYDSQLIASIGDDNVAKLWRKDGTLIRILEGHTDEITDVKFSPDSQLIASTGDDNFVRLWRRDGTPITTLKGHTSKVTSVDFSSNSQIIASVSQGNAYGEGSEIKLWRRDGSPIKKIYNYGIQEIRFSPDSQLIASLNKDKTVKLWSIKGELIKSLEHNGEVTDVSFSPDGEIIASASADNTIKLWRRNDHSIKILRGHNDKVNKVRFSPDGKTIVSVSNDNMVELWSREGNRLKTLQESNYEDSGWGEVSFSSDGKYITFIGYPEKDKSSYNYGYIIKVWSRHGNELKTFQGAFDGVIDSSISSNGRTFALVNKDKALKLWNRNGSPIKTLEGHQDWVNNIIFSPDGKIIASASDDKTVKIWQTDGTFRQTLKHDDKVNSVSFSPDGKIIASASDDKTVKIWQTDGTLIKTLKHDDKVNSVSFSPDGKKIASASDDKTVKLWESDGTPLRKLEHINKVDSITFSPDSKTIAAVSDDNTVKVWPVSGGKELIKPIEGSSDSKVVVDFSPDSRILAVYNSNDSSKINLYILNGVLVEETSLSGKSSLSDFRFSPDNKSIVTVGNDKISVWSLDLDELLVQGCKLARDYLATNVNIKKDDRKLCEGIGTPK